MKQRKYQLISAHLLVVLAVFFGVTSNVLSSASKTYRTLSIKSRVYSNSPDVRLRDLVNNPKMLTQEEQKLNVMVTPVDRNSVYTLKDIAYMLQKYKQLQDVKLRGPRSVVVLKMQNTQYLNKAKEEVRNYIKSHDPWKDWEVDILFSNDDELRITKAGEFESLKVIPYDNKSMIGTLAFKLTLFDDTEIEVNRVIINPVILKKISVVVINCTTRSGQVLNKSDLKTVPMWVGSQKKRYITDISQCAGKELVRKMTYGDILQTTDLLNPVCVKRGEIIWVKCISGSLTVRVSAIALQNGRQGDHIKVKNSSSQKEFMVELVGPKQGIYHLNG